MYATFPGVSNYCSTWHRLLNESNWNFFSLRESSNNTPYAVLYSRSIRIGICSCSDDDYLEDCHWTTVNFLYFYGWFTYAIE